MKLISRVFDEWESRDKAARKKSSSSVLLVPFLTSLLWTLSPLRGQKTPTIGLLVSPFTEIPRNNPPTSPDSPPPPRESFMPNILPSLPSGALPVPLARTFPAVSRSNTENLSRHSDSLQRWGPDTSSSPSGVTQQQQAIRPSSSCEEASGLPSHWRSEGHLVAGLLQSPISGSQARRIVQTNHRFKEVKPISGHTFFQNGNSFLHRHSSTTARMDYQDRPQRCLSSYPGPCEHSQVLSLCYSWKDLPVPCTSVWYLDGTPIVYQDLSTSGSAASYPRDKSSCRPQRLDHLGRFTRTESPTYPTDHPTSTNFGMDYQFEEVYARTLTHSRLLGTAFQSRTSHSLSSRLILRFSHQCPIPSINIHGHVCMQDILPHQSDIALCSLYPSRTPPSQVPAVLDKEN